VLAKEHKSSLLFDLKLASGDLASLLDLKPTHTLADLCQNVARMDRIMFERSLVEHSSGIRLLASPRAFADIGYVTAEGVGQALHLARSLSPYVVVDLDHSFREEQVQVLRQADVILLVIRLDFASLCNGRRTLDYLEQLGVSRERVRLVVNRYGQPKEIPAAKAEEALGCKVFHSVPDDPKTINRANNNGIPFVLESPSAKVSRSVTRLTVSINGWHNGQHK
jgi:pilus assembly protein CpaE